MSLLHGQCCAVKHPYDFLCILLEIWRRTVRHFLSVGAGERGRNIFSKIKLLSLCSPPLHFSNPIIDFTIFIILFSPMSPSVSCSLHARVMPGPIPFDFRGNLKRFLPNSREELQFIPAFHLVWEGLGVRLSVRMSVRLSHHSPGMPIDRLARQYS